LSDCPRSSLPAAVLAWLAGRLASLSRRHVRGDPSGPPRAPWEMAEVGEATCVDGLATRVQRPREWANQKVLYDATPRPHRPGPGGVDRLGRPVVVGRWLARQLPRARAACAVGAWQGSGGQRRGYPAGPRVPGAGQAPRALACASRGSADQRSAQRRAAGVQPRAGQAARTGGAGDRPPRRCLVVAPLAWAAVSRPGRPPGLLAAPPPPQQRTAHPDPTRPPPDPAPAA
jgi:hypothetical protein